MREVSWTRPRGDGEAPKGPHNDYSINLRVCNKFIENIASMLLSGMKVYVGDSHNLKRNILWVCWIPGKSEKIGRIASPIDLHQAKTQFEKEIEEVFSKVYQIAKKNFDSKNVQLQLNVGKDLF